MSPSTAQRHRICNEKDVLIVKRSKCIHKGRPLIVDVERQWGLRLWRKYRRQWFWSRCGEWGAVCCLLYGFVGDGRKKVVWGEFHRWVGLWWCKEFNGGRELPACLLWSWGRSYWKRCPMCAGQREQLRPSLKKVRLQKSPKASLLDLAHLYTLKTARGVGRKGGEYLDWGGYGAACAEWEVHEKWRRCRFSTPEWVSECTAPWRDRPGDAKMESLASEKDSRLFLLLVWHLYMCREKWQNENSVSTPLQICVKRKELLTIWKLSKLMKVPFDSSL